MAPAAYVAKDSLTGHQWEERALGPPHPSHVGECGEEGWGREHQRGLGWGLKSRKPGKGITFEMQINSVKRCDKYKETKPQGLGLSHGLESYHSLSSFSSAILMPVVLKTLAGYK